jgi:hypothetical protein
MTRLSQLLTWVARLVIALWITLMFFHAPGVNTNSLALFPDMIYGKANRPYITRTLLPSTVRTIAEVTPPSVRERIEENPLTSFILSVPHFAKQAESIRPFLYEYSLAILLSYLCLIGFSITLERLWRACYVSSALVGPVVSLVGLLALPPLFKYTSYIYDFPSLLLYTLCLYLLIKQAWGWYLAAFLLACLSKETTVLLIVVFALQFRPGEARERRFYFGLIAAQIAIFAVTRAVIGWIFGSNPGSGLEVHIDHNLLLLLRPYRIEAAVSWALVAAAVFYQWRTKPFALRAAAAMLIPLVGTALLFGYVDELRDYYEVFATVLLLGTHSVLSLAGYPFETIAPTEPLRLLRDSARSAA